MRATNTSPAPESATRSASLAKIRRCRYSMTRAYGYCQARRQCLRFVPANVNGRNGRIDRAPPPLSGAGRSPACSGRTGHNGYVGQVIRSEEHTSELQSLMRISYAVFCLKKKKNIHKNTQK